MANEIENARDGVKTLLENISGLRVYDHEPESVNELPAALIRFVSRGAALTLSGSTFAGTLIVTVLLSKADRQQASEELGAYMDPLGTKSIEAQLDSDNTWGGSVDDGRLTNVGGVREVEIAGGRFLAADLECRFFKQVLS